MKSQTTELTQSLEDYLEAIHMLIESGKPAQVRDVASLLSVKMPSVVKAIHELKKLELVTQEPYSSIELTARGRTTASRVFGRHRLLRSFLVMLGVSSRNADRDACRMEHILTAETLDRIRTFTEQKRKSLKELGEKEK